MKRKITFLIAALCAVILITQPQWVWGQEKTAFTGTFTKITSNDAFVTGFYVITGSTSSSNNSKAMGHSVSSGRVSGETVTITSGTTITNPSDDVVFYITRSGNTCTFKNVNTGQYLYNSADTKGKGTGFQNDSYNITVTGYNTSSPIGFKFSFDNNNTYKVIKWNNSSQWYSNYDGSYDAGMAPVTLYKCPAYTVTYNKNDNNATGTVTDANSPYPSGATVTVKSNGFTNSGYTFSGWNTAPNGSGTPYAEGATFSITANTTLYAQWASATTVATPSIYLDGGTYTGNQSTTISCGTAGASIYYTLDGTTPSSSNGTLYEGAITIDHSCTLKAIGIKDGLTDSEVAEAAYTIKIAAPTFSPAEGTYDATQSVTLSSTAGATIYYTLDGTEPSTSSSVYSSALSITSTKTIKAYAVKANCTDSDVATATYTLKAQTPTFSPAAGEYVGTQSVTLSCATAGAAIHYTTDGTDPTSISPTYSAAISVASSQTIKAIAIKDGLENSEIASAAYTIHQPLTTIDAIYAAAVAGDGDEVEYYVTFGNWVVTGVKNTQAFVTDGTKGFVAYKSGSGNTTGFAEGNILSGTTTSKVKIKLYNGFAEFTNLTSSTGGLTVKTGGTVTPQVASISDLSGINTGSVITLNGVTYNGTNLVDADDHTINPHTTLYSGSYSNGQKYNITGVYQQQTSAPHRILPRKAADIVAVYDPNVAVSPTGTVAIPNYIKGTPEGNITTRNITVSGTHLTNDITVALEDAASSKFEIYDAANTTWTYTLTLSPTTGTVSATAISVRLKAGHNTGDYSDNINITSTGATAKSVSLTGSVKYAHVTYNGNGTETDVPEDDNDYTYNQEVTVLGSGSMTRTGYTFDSWNTEEEGTGTERNENDVFNITEDVTLYAQWTVNTHTLTLPATDAYGEYTADKSSPVAYGTKVTLTYAPEDGYEDYIAQWSSSDVVIASDGTFTMPDKDVTVKVNVIPNPYIKDVLDDDFTGISSSSYTAWTNTDGSASGAAYAGVTAYNSTNGKIQMNTGGSGSTARGIVTTSSGGKFKKVVVTWGKGNTKGRSLSVYGKNSKYTATSDLYDDEKRGTFIGDITYDTETTLIIADDYQYIGLYAASAIYLDEIQIFWEYVLPTAAGALTEDATIAENLIVHETNLTIPAAYTLTIEGTLIVSGTLTNSGDEDNIYIADGGQLYANSVVATVAKDIEDANSRDAGDHWYTISSPVNDGTNPSNPSIPVADVQYLISGPVGFEYDMFSYDEENMLWLNQKKIGDAAGFPVMNVGQGYLYRNSGQTLEFPGETNTGNISYTLSKKSEGKLSGFNLLGNPYPHDITLNHITYSTGENLSGCLVLSDQGSWETKLGVTGKIHSSQGFLVQSDVNGKVATIHEVAQRSRSNNDYIKFAVSNSQYEDVTFALFDKGYGLNKINHRNSEIPMLYIYQNDNKYAIATMDDDTKSFNLNFKAMTMGMYTLSYEATGEFSYLHIIDRLTGADVDMLTEGEYKFVGTSTDSENRFIVRLVYSSDNEEISNEIFAYQSGNDIVVNGSGELQIFDVTGRMVSTKRVNGVETINVPSQGVYIFRLLGTEVQTQKIVVR